MLLRLFVYNLFEKILRHKSLFVKRTSPVKKRRIAVCSSRFIHLPLSKAAVFVIGKCSSKIQYTKKSAAFPSHAADFFTRPTGADTLHTATERPHLFIAPERYSQKRKNLSAKLKRDSPVSNYLNLRRLSEKFQAIRHFCNTLLSRTIRNPSK